jgi:hypothetical protein
MLKIGEELKKQNINFMRSDDEEEPSDMFVYTLKV